MTCDDYVHHQAWYVRCMFCSCRAAYSLYSDCVHFDLQYIGTMRMAKSKHGAPNTKIGVWQRRGIAREGSWNCRPAFMGTRRKSGNMWNATTSSRTVLRRSEAVSVWTFADGVEGMSIPRYAHTNTLKTSTILLEPSSSTAPKMNHRMSQLMSPISVLLPWLRRTICGTTSLKVTSVVVVGFSKAVSNMFSLSIGS